MLIFEIKKKKKVTRCRFLLRKIQEAFTNYLKIKMNGL